MKETQEFKLAEQNMKPGVITAEGFLGHDHRPLADIINQDSQTMASLGITFDKLADVLKRLHEAGMNAQGMAVTVEGKWIVETEPTMGKLPSPFGGDGVYHKQATTVELLKNGQPTGKKIHFNELSIHLVEKFHFLQGVGSPFRLEPQDLKEILDL